jgi:hypothetical protein
VSKRHSILLFGAGLLIGGLVVGYLQYTPSIGAAEAEPWALPDFNYQQFAGPNDPSKNEYVYITGSLIGSDFAYPVNTWKITCTKNEGACSVADVEEIGHRQLGEINVADWPVISWTPTTIVAQDSVGDTLYCARSKITINRQAKTVEFLSVPVNADTKFCRQGRKLLGPTEVQDARIGDPAQPWERH